MTVKESTNSVFTDDSGARKRVVTWAIRGASGILLVGALAAGVSIFGHVALPGLEAPLHIPGIGQTDKTNAPPDRSTTAATRGPNADSAATSGRSSTSDKSDTPAVAPTPTPVKVTGKPTAKPTTAANPAHEPGSPPSEPPGKSKKLSTDG